MTKNACEFVTPLTFESLSQNRVISDMFDRNFDFEIEHISIAKKADIFVVAPATMNVIGKFSNGICDDMLTTTYAACKAKKIICPAMNTAMFENETEKENIEKLSKSALIINGMSGRLACGDFGEGKLADPQIIIEKIIETLLPKQDLKGKKVLVTAGATIEKIDDIRFITNFSSGKMGCEIAMSARRRGADVILVAGNLSVTPPPVKTVSVKTTLEMFNAVLGNLDWADIIIKAAAPSDYKVENFTPNKLKSEKLTLNLIKNPDIAKAVGEKKGKKKLVIFCAETENLLESAKNKLISKNADMVVANDVTKPGAGFNVDTNIVSIITNAGTEDFNIMPKSVLADIIFDKVLKLN
ncbi:homo-oligomeric flavin containing cys decarboxylase family [Holotrichia oblita]|nr:homo-oligomeric flavin containing cys decarboxylase family [Holotrichia oblita]